MISRKSLTAAALATAISVGSIAAPTMAATSTHWTSTQCKTWEKSFVKRNPNATSKRKGEANKVLKSHACSVRVK